MTEDQLVFSLFDTWPVYGVPGALSWPSSPSLSVPEATRTGLRRGIELAVLADEFGFDYVTVAEHHYHPRQLSPNPLLSAAVLSQHLKRAGVAVLGATLPLVNPVRAAEEIAMVDAMLDGNMIIGLFRGTPHELLTYGTNPAETRDMFEEAVSLLVNAWTQPEAFAWFGRHYEYRTVAVWPRPVSSPHPRILVSANSVTSALYAARNRYKVGVAFAPAPRTAEMVNCFLAEAAEQGYTPPASDILHRSHCFVAETDREAEQLVEQAGFGDMSAAFAITRDYGVTDALKQAMAAGEKSSPAGPSNAPPVGPPRGGPRRLPTFVGSPDTVAARIREFAATTGVGHFDLVFSDPSLDFADTRRSVELFGREVMPQLKDAVLA
jgi:alkanesulfonate monooxygenase SsuD/methylene tetrahydromethanopterin reductase-like flavin-dependent oxidoreductase (luciferase family)